MLIVIFINPIYFCTTAPCYRSSIKCPITVPGNPPQLLPFPWEQRHFWISAFRFSCKFLQSPSLYSSLFSIYFSPSPGDTLWCPVSYCPLRLPLRVSASRTTEYLSCYKAMLCLTPWYGFVSSFGFVCTWLLSAFTRLTLHWRGLNGSWGQNSVRSAWSGRGEKWFVLWHFVRSLPDPFHSVASLFASVSYFCSFIFLFHCHSFDLVSILFSNTSPLPIQFYLLSSTVLLSPYFLLSNLL